MASLYEKVRQKADAMFKRYGGMMTTSDLSRELGVNRDAAKAWAKAEGIGNLVGKRVKYETDEVARRIVETRGMW